MEHKRHSTLIDELARIVREEPTPGTHPWPHIQTCWSHIKQIGPAFKDTDYPHPKAREAAWSRFQKAVSSLKEFQTRCENRSSETRTLVLELLKTARVDVGTGFNQARELGDKAEAAAGSPFQRKQQLQACTVAQKEALARFNELKWQLTPAHFKLVSDRLREARQELQKAWDTFKKEARQQPKPKGKPAAHKPAKPAGGIAMELEAEKERLHSRRNVLAGLERILPAITEPVRKKQTQRWCEECREDIAELEASIARLQGASPRPSAPTQPARHPGKRKHR